MTVFLSKKLPVLLLALVIALSLCCTTALAADDTNIPEIETDVHPEESCNSGDCEHEQEDEPPFAEEDKNDPAEASPEEVTLPEETPAPSDVPALDEQAEPETSPVPEEMAFPETEAVETCGNIGDSTATWELDMDTGKLFISGHGKVDDFRSEEDQPWRALRERILDVCFDAEAHLTIDTLCHWFDGCCNLLSVDVPEYVAELSLADFKDCIKIEQVIYGGLNVLEDLSAEPESLPIQDCSEETDAETEEQREDSGFIETRFSITVPVNLSLIVSETGAVYSASNAELVNNSSAAVEIIGITVQTENGWRLVPYSFNMADAKVDSKQIGVFLNGAESEHFGITETLNLPEACTISPGEALPLEYGAVVSAFSNAFSEQVLTVIFVLDWASP